MSDTYTKYWGMNWYYGNSIYETSPNKLSLSTGQFFNYQITRKVSSPSVDFWQNRTSLGNNTNKGNGSNSYDLILGKGWDTGTTYLMDGKIGWFAVYNRALTDSELDQNYNYVRTRYGV